ncbi:MAG: hypothetical protein HOD92_26970 [Deltaproteobacteria bacterium]|jgi:hypothetical protein|nr:hypothetical protein [Deltaproteobacteria bacterium]
MSIKNQKIKAFSVYASADLFNKINMIAKSNDRNRNQQVVRFLKKGVLNSKFKNSELNGD